ncbi:MAG: PH domain-containing protein [Oscillospiraceae bacterium]
MEYKNAHFITVFENITKYFAFLIIPVIRAIMVAGDGFFMWIFNAWIDILIIFLILVYTVLRWKFNKYAYDKTHISIKKGIFIKRVININFKNISTYTIKRQFLYKPFGAVQILIDTDGGVYGKSDAKIIISKKDSLHFMKHLNKTICQQGQKSSFIKSYKCQTKYLVLISALMSNTFIGIVFTAVFINKSGQIIGTELQNKFIGMVTSVGQGLFAGISPLAAFIAYSLIGGWLVGAIYNIILMSSFIVKRYSKTLTVSRGVFTNHDFLISTKKINFVSIKQTLMTKILRIYSIYIQSAGYSSKKEKFDLIVPAITKKEFKTTNRMLLDEFTFCDGKLKPKKSSFYRYLYLPIFYLAIITPVFFVLKEFFQNWSELINFIYIMGLILGSWFLILRIVSFFTASCNCEKGTVEMCYPKKLKINKTFILKEKIVMYRLKENIFQTKKQICDFTVYSYGETKCTHKVKSLNKNDVIKLFYLPVN